MTDKGGTRSGAGRKKGSTTGGTGYKTARIVISCQEEQVEAIKAIARAQNTTMSQLILKTVLGQ